MSLVLLGHFKKDKLFCFTNVAIFGDFWGNIIKQILQFKQQKCPSSIQFRDLNSRPLEHESLPITTRTLDLHLKIFLVA